LWLGARLRLACHGEFFASLRIPVRLAVYLGSARCFIAGTISEAHRLSASNNTRQTCAAFPLGTAASE
jgi:hypothetical protein